MHCRGHDLTQALHPGIKVPIVQQLGVWDNSLCLDIEAATWMLDLDDRLMGTHHQSAARASLLNIIILSKIPELRKNSVSSMCPPWVPILYWLCVVTTCSLNWPANTNIFLHSAQNSFTTSRNLTMHTALTRGGYGWTQFNYQKLWLNLCS